MRFTIPIEPKPQKRDRITARGGFVRSYKDTKQAKYETQIACMLEQHRPEKPLEGALELRVICYLPIPKSKTKKFKAAAIAGEERPTGKPDCDNMLKNIEDIMEGIFYRNDSQIVTETVHKFYSGNPRWEITLNTAD